jgi:SAP domain-containing ribonucleoprotein
MSTSYRQLKVPELKELLAKKGLPVSGKKEDLVARLLAAEDKKPVETINQTSRNSSNTNPARKSSIENIINKDPVDQNDLFDKELNLMATTDITTGIDNDFDWENLTTDITLQKDGEFDTLISPISPSLSVTSIKELSPEKAKTEITETTKGTTNVEAKQSVETTKNLSFNESKTLKTESSSSTDSIVKPSGFTCKKIVFDNHPTTTSPLSPSKSQSDLATELERRKKRAERFGVELSDADKKLQRAARFGTTVSNPLDAPLTAPRMPNRKPSVVEDDEKLKKRAERFGLDKSNTSNEDEKKRKRAERFGLNAPSNSASVDNPSTTSSNSVLETNEEKKKRRAERFDTNGEPTNKKVKT